MAKILGTVVLALCFVTAFTAPQRPLVGPGGTSPPHVGGPDSLPIFNGPGGKPPVVGPGGTSPPYVGGPDSLPIRPIFNGPGGIPPQRVGGPDSLPIRPIFNGPGGIPPQRVGGPDSLPIRPGGLPPSLPPQRIGQLDSRPPPLVVAGGANPTNPTSPVKGGLGAEQAADENVNGLVEKLRHPIIQKICTIINGKCPADDSHIQVLAFKEQTVAGTNYFVKIVVNGDHYHARIFQQTWTKTLELSDLKPVTKEAALAYF